MRCKVLSPCVIYQLNPDLNLRRGFASQKPRHDAARSTSIFEISIHEDLNTEDVRGAQGELQK
jgi:hypothetical protein